MPGRGWYALGKPGRAFGARDRVAPHDGTPEVVDSALFVGLSSGIGFRPRVWLAMTGDRWPVFHARLVAELHRRLGGRALDRALAQLPPANATDDFPRRLPPGGA